MSVLNQALEIVSEAVNVDSSGRDKKRAFELYDRAISLFETAVASESDPQRRQYIIQNLKEYKSRSNLLKQQFLKEHPEFQKSLELPLFPTPPTVPVSSQPNTTVAFKLPFFESPDKMYTSATANLAAVELSELAKTQDEMNNHGNALEALTAALSYYMRALELERNEQVRANLMEAVKKHMNRAEILKELVSASRFGNTGLICSYPDCEIKNIAYGEDYKVYQDKPYHVKCLDAVTGQKQKQQTNFKIFHSKKKGLERDEMHTFLLLPKDRFVSEKAPKTNLFLTFHSFVICATGKFQSETSKTIFQTWRIFPVSYNRRKLCKCYDKRNQRIFGTI